MAEGVVLVIDDDFDGAETVVDLLEQAGMRAVSAKDGREGLYEMRSRGDIGVVILDLDMTMMDGPAFRKEQLADPQLASVPVIVVSGKEDVTDQADAMGATAALRKPIHVATLLSLVRAAR